MFVYFWRKLREREREMAEYTKRHESTDFVKSVAREEDMESIISSKKRKLYSELEIEDQDGAELPESSPVELGDSRCTNNDDKDSNGVLQKSLRSPDLENVDDDMKSKGSKTESSIDGFSREVTPTSELSGESEQGLMGSSSTSKKKSPPTHSAPRRRMPTAKMPSAWELEEFFAAAEMCQQKQFTEKYNFDIVKDVPLEGKYQWVRLHP